MKVSVAELLVDLELGLHDPDVRRSQANIAALLADGFVEFGSSGRVYTKSETVAALVAESPTDIRADGFVAKELAPGVALLTYRTTTDGVEALRSSIRVESSDGWQMVFHQGTPS
jgi:hypothetical protein